MLPVRQRRADGWRHAVLKVGRFGSRRPDATRTTPDATRTTPGAILVPLKGALGVRLRYRIRRALPGTSRWVHHVR